MDAHPQPARGRVHELLNDWVVRAPDALALRDAFMSVTYRELSEILDATALRLADAGVRAGDRVVLVGENSVALCVLFLALSKLDAWTVPVNPRLSEREIKQFVEHSGARLVLFLGETSQEAREHARRAAATAFVSDLGDISIGPLAETAVPEPAIDDPRQQVAAMVYTSGTTGSSKGVMLTHANLVFVATSARDVRSLGPGDVVYGVLPMAHVVGLSTQFLGSMCAGATLLLEPRFSAEGAVKALQNSGVTVFTGVPALFARILEWSRKNTLPIDARRLRLVSVAGSPLTPSLKAEIQQAFKLPLQNGYGLTETGPTIAQTRLDAPRDDCSVGPAIAQVEVRVVDREGLDVPTGAVGELWARGPGVMKGYYKNPELTAAVLSPEGWFNTGDMASLSDDGALFISGRTKELIIRSGFNVYPLEIEQVLNAFPGIVQSAVVGREVGHNEEIVAFLETKEGMAPDEADLRAYLRKHLSPYKQPTEIRLMAALPSAPSGKILKTTLRELAQAVREAA